MKKQIKVIWVGCLVILAAFSGALVQKYVLSDDTSSTTSKQVSVDKVAIVNMDEGVKSGEKQINYGNELLSKVNDIDLVSLDAARSGMKSNKYGAYLIVPENFSETVNSINLTNPDTALIKYEINENLSKDSLATNLNKVTEVESTLNYEIGYMYLTSILKEVHHGQDQVNDVTKNEQAILDSVSTIQTMDLVALVEVKQFEKIEKEVKNLDLSNEQTKYASLIEEQKQLNDESKTEIGTEYTNVSNEVTSLSSKKFTLNVFYNDNGDTVYNGTALKQNVTDDVKTKLDHIIDTTTIGAIAKIKEEMKNTYGETIRTVHKATFDAFEADVTTYCSPMNTLTSEININYDAGLCEVAINDFMREVSDETATVDLVPAIVDDGTGTSTNASIEDVIKNEQKNSADTNMTVTNLSNNIVTLNGVNEINGGYIYNSLYAPIKAKVDSYNSDGGKLSELNNQVDVVTTTTGEFDPTSILDSKNSKLDSNISSGNSNVDSIFNKTEAYAKEQDAVKAKVVLDANSEISELQANIQKMKSASDKQVTDGLSEAKSVASTKRKDNISLLESFTSMLKNTRNQETQNKEIKDHILSPSKVNNEVKERVSIATTEANEETTPWLLIGGIGLLIVVLGGGYLLFTKKD